MVGLLVALMASACQPEQADDSDPAPPPQARDRGPQQPDAFIPPPMPEIDMEVEPDMELEPDMEVDLGPRTACNDGLDNDGDGLVDGDDPGCEDGSDDDEAEPIPLPACRDGIDNDEDGYYDLADSDCLAPEDPTERGENPITACSNGVDDDGDGFVDFPVDPGCGTAGDANEVDPPEAPACANDADDDGDGKVDYPSDPGCEGRGDADEADPDPAPACGNEIDDDDNGLTDFPEDPGCQDSADRVEENPCGPGVRIVDLNAHLVDRAAFDGTLEGREDQVSAVCGGRAGGEVVFTWRVDRLVESVTFSTRHDLTLAPTVLYVRAERCDGEELACDRGSDEVPGTEVTLERPQPGLYFVVVDTGSRENIGAFRLTVDVVFPPQCRDGVDNDEDGLLDRDDPGCAAVEDDDEIDPEVPPVCSNGVDDDMDGLTDYPADDECLTAGYDREQPLCDLPIPFATVGQDGGRFDLDAPDIEAPSAAQGSCGGFGTQEGVLVLTLDEPSDVFVQTYFGDVPTPAIIYAREDCLLAEPEVACRQQGTERPLHLDNLDRGVYFIFVEQPVMGEVSPITAEVVVESNIRECNDLIDNDGDGDIDLADRGCVEGFDDSEGDPPDVPECDDGIDNDEDGAIDWPDDQGCTGAGDPREIPLCMFNDDVVEVGQAGGRVQYDTNGQPSVGRARCGGGGPQAVVALTLQRASTVSFTIVDRDYDTLIHLRSVCDDADTEIACNDDFNGLASAIQNQRLEAGTYFLFLDGFGGRAGTGTVEIVVQ